MQRVNLIVEIRKHFLFVQTFRYLLATNVSVYSKFVELTVGIIVVTVQKEQDR